MEAIKTEKLTKYYGKARGITGVDIVASGGLDPAKISVGFAFAAAFIKYRKKDIS